MSHLNTYFWLFVSKFWEVAETYKWYFYHLCIQVEWWDTRHSNSTYCNLIDLNFLQMLKNLACTCAHPTSHLVKVSLPNIYYHPLCPLPPPTSDLGDLPRLVTSGADHWRPVHLRTAAPTYWHLVVATEIRTVAKRAHPTGMLCCLLPANEVWVR